LSPKQNQNSSASKFSRHDCLSTVGVDALLFQVAVYIRIIREQWNTITYFALNRLHLFTCICTPVSDFTTCSKLIMLIVTRKNVNVE